MASEGMTASTMKDSEENHRRIPAELEMMEKNFEVTNYLLGELENRLASVLRVEQESESRGGGESVGPDQAPLTHTLQAFRELQLRQHRKLESIMTRLEA